MQLPTVDDNNNDVETSKLSVLIPKGIHKRAKVFATEKEIPLKDVVAEALEQYMAARNEGAAA